MSLSEQENTVTFSVRLLKLSFQCSLYIMYFIIIIIICIPFFSLFNINFDHNYLIFV